VKLGSLKFCLLLSLLCHLAGFAAFKWFAPAATTPKISAPVSVPIVVFSTEPVLEKFSPPPLDKKSAKLFAPDNFFPLKKLTAPPAEKQFAELVRGQTVTVNAARLAEPASNHIIVGTRISRVFAIANIQPEYFKNPKPEYPEVARQARQAGIVWLRVHITERGQPDRVAVAQSSGFAVLDAAAVNAVRGWEFAPAQLGEVPVESEIDFPIQFRLE
jgi:periplasmic protein TonB